MAIHDHNPLAELVSILRLNGIDERESIRYIHNELSMNPLYRDFKPLADYLEKYLQDARA